MNSINLFSCSEVAKKALANRRAKAYNELKDISEFKNILKSIYEEAKKGYFAVDIDLSFLEEQYFGEIEDKNRVKVLEQYRDALVHLGFKVKITRSNYANRIYYNEVEVKWKIDKGEI